jgi:hypothetical protein
MFGYKRDELVGGWRKVHNEELHKVHILPNITRIGESRKMGWVGHLEEE